MGTNLKSTIENLINNTTSYNDKENCDEKAETILYEKLKEYENRNPTSKLWTQ